MRETHHSTRTESQGSTGFTLPRFLAQGTHAHRCLKFDLKAGVTPSDAAVIRLLRTPDLSAGEINFVVVFGDDAGREVAPAAYGKLCGWTLARAHARAGDRIAISGYLGRGETFDRAIAAFAERYADQNEVDYKGLQDAVASGRVQAATEATG